LAKIRKDCGIALAVATSGIAATLLEGGKTAHSTFKLPINLMQHETPTCNISKQSNIAQVLKECKLIIWDECTMAHKGGFEALNRTLKDIRGSSCLMGGVTVLLAGDFRQTLPVIPRGTRADEVKACLKSSYLWPLLDKISLHTNMRVHLRGDESAGVFADMLLKIGNGSYPSLDGKITLPPNLCTIVTLLPELTATIYPDIQNIHDKSIEWLCERAILTPKNDNAAAINQLLLNAFDAEIVQYKSFDSVLQSDDAVHYPVEFLNSLNPSSLPPHILNLKVGAPIMLVRNLRPPKLCNGTRLQIKALHKNVVEATVITGCARSEVVYIPRIPLIPSDYPFEFKRIQFPLKLCFAMTINKSQGQSLKLAGIDLREDCFSHGQFYVACSRVSSANSLVILAPKGNTANVVYKEVLR
jgi:ATP-dependent DNA helicase PIF1